MDLWLCWNVYGDKLEKGKNEMRKFCGFYDNGRYRVGCNGPTMYVYNRNDEELARFRVYRKGPENLE